MRRVVELVLLLLLAPAIASAQADYAREKRWADEIVPAIVVGDAEWLSLSSGRKFLAIHAPAPAGRPAVVVVHGMGVHPDWGLINALRSGVAEAGYATLSVQMPVLAAEAPAERYATLFPEAAERIERAAAFLRERGHGRIALVAHSVGARMSDYYLAHTHDSSIAAWVAVGLSGRYTALDTFKGPVLDLYGERDLAPVRDNAAARAESLRRSRGSAQVEVASANHFFEGHEADLVSNVKLFLERTMK